jgi:hypothetical protein
MRRIVVLVGAVAVLSIAGLIYAQSSSSGSIPGGPQPLGYESLTSATRGATKTLGMETNVPGTGGFVNFTLLPEHEIDVTSATYTVLTGAGEIFQTRVQVLYNGTDITPIIMHSTGSGTTHLTFETPVPLRADDTIQISSAGAASMFVTTHRLVLHGLDATPPPAVMASDSIKVE